MGIKPYLIFSLHQARYAIAAASVTEIFLLPELTPVVEAPADIVGLLNLHAAYVPVMHLDLRFGHKFDRCHVTDSVIVIESQTLQIGVIVHRVETVIDIDDCYIQADLSYGRPNIHQAFVQGVINLDDEMITLLNIDNLVRHPEAVEALLASEAEAALETPSDFYAQYFADASLNTKKVLQQRAINLKETASHTVVSELISLAVVSLAGRYFALDLAIVREFINVSKISTIPCCPDHVIGNMNLRGEILTLVNIAPALKLELEQTSQLHKAMVVEVDDIVAGIVVDEVYDVIDFHPEELKPVPAAMSGVAASYLQGIAEYQGQTLNIIDLPKLLRAGEMTVELTA